MAMDVSLHRQQQKLRCFVREVLLTSSGNPATRDDTWISCAISVIKTGMKRSKKSFRACPNLNCSLKGQLGRGNIIRHSFYITTQGRRRR